MPQQMEDSPQSRSSEKLWGLIGGNGMIMSEQGRICCEETPAFVQYFVAILHMKCCQNNQQDAQKVRPARPQPTKAPEA
jgi:hypothetical protein